jgi:ABC-type Zn2+ transport system substrate-binding protein/surface adhesin
MTNENKQVNPYRLVVLLNNDIKDALDRLVEKEQEATLISVTQSDVVRKLIVRAAKEDHCMAEPS